MNLRYAIKLLKENNYIVEATSQKYCMNCGAPVDPHNNFCTNCGAELEADEDVGSKEEAEKELGKLAIIHHKYCTECGEKITSLKYGRYCTECGADLIGQNDNNTTFKNSLQLIIDACTDSRNMINIKYGIKDGYYRFIIDVSKIEALISKIMNSDENVEDELYSKTKLSCKNVMNAFKKTLEKLKQNNPSHLRYKNAKFYYECPIKKFNVHELNMISNIIIEYFINDTLTDTLNALLK